MPTRDRKAVEAELLRASDAINQRLGALEDEVRLPSLPEAIGGNSRARKVGFAVVAGLAVGLVLGGIGRSRRKRGREWKDGVADEIGRLIESGSGLSESVRQVLDQPPPAAKKQKKSNGLLGMIVGYSVRTAVNALVQEFLGRSNRGGARKDSGPDVDA